jgi:hypothetical protein
MVEENTFDFWVPISKSKAADDGKSRVIEGIASTADMDLQNERVEPNGIDFDYFLKHGYFNWDHKPGAQNKVGEPLECKITPKGLYVKGIVYKGKQVADAVWEHIKALGNNPDSQRKMGFSLQGKTTRRNGKNILRCWVQDIAITTAPINYNTYLDIVKSLGEVNWCETPDANDCVCCKSFNMAQGGKVTTPESLHDDTTVVTYNLSDKDEEEKEEEKKREKKKITKKSLATSISNKLGYSSQSSELLADVLFALSY